jgi:ADP-ribose pyrophosphatase YjhB (NUDIX family)
MNKFPVACVGVVKQEKSILMVKEGKKRAEGKWALPGGGLEKQETLKECVEREVEEETGIKTKAEELIGIYIMDSDSGERMFVYAYNCSVKKETSQREDETVQEYKFIDQKELSNLELRYSQAEHIIEDSKTSNSSAVKYY